MEPRAREAWDIVFSRLGLYASLWDLFAVTATCSSLAPKIHEPDFWAITNLVGVDLVTGRRWHDFDFTPETLRGFLAPKLERIRTLFTPDNVPDDFLRIFADFSSRMRLCSLHLSLDEFINRHITQSGVQTLLQNSSQSLERIEIRGQLPENWESHIVFSLSSLPLLQSISLRAGNCVMDNRYYSMLNSGCPQLETFVCHGQLPPHSSGALFRNLRDFRLHQGAWPEVLGKKFADMVCGLRQLEALEVLQCERIDLTQKHVDRILHECRFLREMVLTEGSWLQLVFLTLEDETRFLQAAKTFSTRHRNLNLCARIPVGAGAASAKELSGAALNSTAPLARSRDDEKLNEDVPAEPAREPARTAEEKNDGGGGRDAVDAPGGSNGTTASTSSRLLAATRDSRYTANSLHRVLTFYRNSANVAAMVARHLPHVKVPVLASAF